MPAYIHHDAGQLDRRVTIQEIGPKNDDGMRSKEGGWFDKVTRFASVMPLSGAERIAAGETAAFRTQKFRLRRPSDFTVDPARHRLSYQGAIYDITDVQQPDRRWIDVIASARAEKK